MNRWIHAAVSQIVNIGIFLKWTRNVARQLPGPPKTYSVY